MAVAVHHDAPAPARRWTADEVWRIVDTGILGEDERVELLDGQIHVVTPPEPDHALIIDDLGMSLWGAYGSAFRIRIQAPMDANARNIPEPDLTVRPASGPWIAERRHPRLDESLLVIEVSVTNRRTDRRKVRIYAEAGAPEYWIVDVPRRVVVVHTGPRPDGTWDEIHQAGDRDVLRLPGLAITLPVAEMLPPAEGPSPGASSGVDQPG